jgi:hypothetical protein
MRFVSDIKLIHSATTFRFFKQVADFVWQVAGIEGKTGGNKIKNPGFTGISFLGNRWLIKNESVF